MILHAASDGMLESDASSDTSTTSYLVETKLYLSEYSDMTGKFRINRPILIPGVLFLAAIATACGVGASDVNEGSVQNTASEVPQVVQESSGNLANEQVTGAIVDSEVANNDEQKSRNSTVEPDPDYKEAFVRAGLRDRGWDTDFSLHTVPYDEITFVIPQDGIPAIDSPGFVTNKDAEGWLTDTEPVVSFELNGEARAYPLQILTWHEIVNDVVGGVPVAATFCPLCNSAIVFDRRFGGEVLDFAVSGNLRNSDLIMFDRQSQTWWQQFTGEGIVGKNAGFQLEVLSAFIISFEDFKQAHPEGLVLSRDTGFIRSYGQNPYAGYDRADNPPFLFAGDTDGRLLPKERVVAVTIDDIDAAFPLERVQDEKVINYTVGSKDLAVFFKSGTTSALDGSSIASSRNVGATAVFDPHVNGQKLTFRSDGDKIVDNETGSVWNILGQGIEGPLSGEKLSPIIHGDHFWFAWAAFKPDTIIYQGQQG